MMCIARAQVQIRLWCRPQVEPVCCVRLAKTETVPLILLASYFGPNSTKNVFVCCDELQKRTTPRKTR